MKKSPKSKLPITKLTDDRILDSITTSSSGEGMKCIKFDPEYAGEEINHPKHYNVGTIEVYDFIMDQKLDFTIGTILKYLCRAKYKGHYLKDLRKAEWYLQKIIRAAEEAGGKR